MCRLSAARSSRLLATAFIAAMAAWFSASGSPEGVKSVGTTGGAAIWATAAFVVLWALRLSSKPADHNHDYGHGKAEYMSSAVEGSLIFVAAAGIILSAVQRLIRPQPIEAIGLGLGLSIFASVLNLVTA